jgi:hypothetical protein
VVDDLDDDRNERGWRKNSITGVRLTLVYHPGPSIETQIFHGVRRMLQVIVG